MLLPSFVAIILLSSGFRADIVHCRACPADILSALLLMILMKQYSVSGRKFFSVLAYMLGAICVAAGAVRMLVSDRTVYIQNADPAVFYPLSVGVVLLLSVIFYVRIFRHSRSGKVSGISGVEEMFSCMLFISSFFFVLVVSVYGMMIDGGAGVALTVFSAVAASGLYYIYFRRYSVEVADSGLSVPSVLSPPVLGVAEQDDKSEAVKELYGRIVDLFDADKPYLIDGITVSEVARMLFTNKVYVSRAINDYTGKNFCQFVNYYRVQYAVKIFNENPYLKVGDLSDMSGFHTLVSFNMAFRLIMNESPSEWCRKVRTERHCTDRKN